MRGAPVGRNAVRTGEHAERQVRHQHAVGSDVRAGVVPHLVGDREQPVVPVERRRDRVDLVPRMVRRDQVLRAILDPLHGPTRPRGEPRHQEVLRVELAADAEPPTRVGRVQPDLLHGDLEHRGQHPAVEVRDLRRSPDLEPPAARGGEQPSCLERHPRMPADGEFGVDDVGRVRERRLDVPVAHLELGGAIGLAQVEHRRELLDLEHDELRRILGRVRVVGEHDRDGLTDVAHTLARQDRLQVRVERLVRDLDPDRDRAHVRQVRPGHDRMHAFGRARRARVHLAQDRVGDLRADHPEPELIGQIDVVDETAATGQQSRVFDPERPPGAGHGSVDGSATASAARRTARRMFW